MYRVSPASARRSLLVITGGLSKPGHSESSSVSAYQWAALSESARALFRFPAPESPPTGDETGRFTSQAGHPGLSVTNTVSPRPESDSESVCQCASSSGLSPCQARVARLGVSPGLQVQCQRWPFLGSESLVARVMPLCRVVSLSWPYLGSPVKLCRASIKLLNLRVAARAYRSLRHTRDWT